MNVTEGSISKDRQPSKMGLTANSIYGTERICGSVKLRLDY